MHSSFSILTSDRGIATLGQPDLYIKPFFFQYPNLGSWDCNIDNATLTDAILDFQYPNLGSWDCNSDTVGGAASDTVFQYPNLGSWDCNLSALT